MRNTHFQFKQFALLQDKAAMKLGTDSVLLGCFTEVGEAKCILDIGTGTGILALMMAQKSNALIDAVEIDQEAFKQAEQNAKESPWHDRIKIHHTAIQNFQAFKKYDIIISNPPYYRNSKNMGIEDEKRALARHDKDLPFEDLCKQVYRLMKDDALFWLILPHQEGLEFIQIAKQHNLQLHHLINIKPKPEKEINRLILAFDKSNKTYIESTITIYQSDGIATDEYVELTKDFYLWKDRT
jgi:tRNA1Val (adenine37-N6)-methyltransferase